MFSPEWDDCRKALVTLLERAAVQEGDHQSRVGRLPKGIGDLSRRTACVSVNASGPEWDDCRKALVTAHARAKALRPWTGPEWDDCRKALVTHDAQT